MNSINNSTKIDVHGEVVAAESRIREHIRETPAEFSPVLSKAGECQVYLKLECFQKTGSFKFRGATNKFLSLTPAERASEIITASSGNHGAAFASIMQEFDGKGIIYLPQNASPAKVEVLRQFGVQLEFFGDDCVMSETLALKTAKERNLVFVSPYNDLQIIGGQGTIAIELERQIVGMDAVFVPIGGGGLVAGIAGYLKEVKPNIDIIGCQPAASPVMYESVQAGKIIEMESLPTMADGTAGGIEPDSITFDICRQTVDDYILVSEEDIKAAIRLMLEHHQILIEGAAALSVAAFLKCKSSLKNKNVVLIISGKKISLEKLREVLF
ncbi:MAG: threonine/serine dehydratase [Proteobacteria bacterium]|nr:threonine/serine dehydratase [Pseudomonadota bacterium]